MGFFDYVRFEYPCKKCGTVLTDWQTKDGLMAIETLEIGDINNGGLIYTSCDNCNMWNQYKVTINYNNDDIQGYVSVYINGKKIYNSTQKMISNIVLEDTADFEDNA